MSILVHLPCISTAVSGSFSLKEQAERPRPANTSTPVKHRAIDRFFMGAFRWDCSLWPHNSRDFCGCPCSLRAPVESSVIIRLRQAAGIMRQTFRFWGIFLRNRRFGTAQAYLQQNGRHPVDLLRPDG